MITEWPSIGHSSSDPSIIHGSSHSILIALKNSQYGFMNGGSHTDLQPIYYHQQHSKASIGTFFKPKDCITSKQFNTTKNSKYHGFSAGATKSHNTTVLQTNSQ